MVGAVSSTKWNCSVNLSVFPDNFIKLMASMLSRLENDEKTRSLKGTSTRKSNQLYFSMQLLKFHISRLVRWSSGQLFARIGPSGPLHSQGLEIIGAYLEELEGNWKFIYWNLVQLSFKTVLGKSFSFSSRWWEMGQVAKKWSGLMDGKN